MRTRLLIAAVLAALMVVAGAAALIVVAGAAAPCATTAATSSEVSTTTRLADRRSIIVGDRFYEVGAEDASYPATGWHIHGEMGGFWTQPIKLLDGIWFKFNDQWLSASEFTNGWGYSRMDLGSPDGVSIQRTDVAPDGIRAGLIRLTLTSPDARSVRLTVDAHSELM